MAENRRKKYESAVKREKNRLRKVYAELPPKKLAVADGLIDQAARLRVQLNELSADIAENGITELFQQSEKCEPYARERPAYGAYLKADKNYQAVIQKLDAMVPAEAVTQESVKNAFDCE